ncbi:MAG: asparagine synthetase B [Porphyrobacter sp.]|nr:asparagine synthetase B [Porphyrobacter sp.]
MRAAAIAGAVRGGGEAVSLPGAYRCEPGLAVLADARLDNRAALAQRLGLAPQACPGELIAAAYRRWGDECITRLEGDFAFAVWDAPRRRLLLGRDRMGVRPLYWSLAGGRLRFAQDAAGALPGSEADIRCEAMADFLYGRVLDAEGTWFAGVERLPAAHLLIFEEGAARTKRYYTIAPAPPEPGHDPAETLRALLGEAIARRTAGAAKVGALLSGGLDSSSIACLLRDQRISRGEAPLPVFAMMFREPAQSNERAHFDAVVATGGFDPVVIEMDGYDPLAGFEGLLADLGGPTLSPNLACLRPVVAAAAQRGVEVLFDGHGGDEVVSHGYGLLDELAARGAWRALLREARGAADNYGRSRLVLARRVAARQQRRDARLIARLLAPFDRETAHSANAPAHLLSDELVAESRLRERLRAFAKPETAAGEQAQHRAVLSDPLQPYAFEVHAAFYASLGVAARYPFWDRQVVEFCLGLPAEEKLANGWSRLVLRRAMTGIVPASVLARRDKIDFTVHLARGLVRHHRARIEALLGDPAGPLAPFIDREKATRLFAAIAADPDAAPGRAVQMVWRAVAMGIWLETRAAAEAPTHREEVAA